MFRFCKNSDCFSGLLFVPFLILMGTNVHGTSQQTSSDLSNQISNYETIDWIDLIPKEDLDILLNPPSYITDVEDGSIEDKICLLYTSDGCRRRS